MKQELNASNEVISKKDIFKVHAVRHLTNSAYVVRFDRRAINFIAGQHLSVGLANHPQAREYSIYSAEQDTCFEILVKEIEDGMVSKQLKKVKVGDLLRVAGPMGTFKLDAEKIATHPHLLVATGTGISPFHSFIKSYPQLNFQLIHGVRFGKEGYDSDHYKPNQYTLCTSRDAKGNFKGRVTDYLRTLKMKGDIQVYLCGNCDMIFEAYDILTEKGIPTENIHTEVYF